ncbi:helix-turn-helix domain-containing protein [Mesorhizobium sp. M0217]|uniref:helix-turn-helix domain-containing protein n=1 Tax=unclassified Mesorhizobium TaxID=325217 RepID=UPI003338A3E6
MEIRKKSPIEELKRAFEAISSAECPAIPTEIAPRMTIEGSLGALPTPRNPDKPNAAEISAFTSAKLDMIDWILRDHRKEMTPSAKNTAIYLLQCVNAATLQCNPSYQTIADALGFKDAKTAERAVKALKHCEWIDIRRYNRNKSNRYVFLSNAKVTKGIDDYQDHLRDQRKAEREQGERASLEQTNMSGRAVIEPTFVPPPEQTNMSGKHLKGIPEVVISFEGEEPYSKAISENGYAAAKSDDLHIPFPSPSSEDELAAVMSSLFADVGLGPLTLQRMRTLLATGRLTPAIVQGQRRTEAA